MRIVGTLLGLLLLFCTLIFGALIYSRTHGKPFVAIKPGDSQSLVESRVGRPTRTMACGSLPEPPASCATVLVYAGPLSHLMPEFWLVPLDAQARVIRVLHTTRAD